MIVAAAIIYDGELWTLPRPARHHDIIKAHHDVTGKGGSGVQGFVTNLGTFMNRCTAATHAMECGQPTLGRVGRNPLKSGGRLYSEDLW